jgi:H+/Cl- antiporter ClcA
LLVGAVLVAVAIKPCPAAAARHRRQVSSCTSRPLRRSCPGVIAAALATLCFGMVLGPEMPLILLGGGLAAAAVRLVKKDAPEQATTVVASAGSFAAISTLLGSPIIGAFLLMEASGLGGAMLGVVLVPGLLAAGIGSLIFVGLDSLTGLGTFSLAIPGLPAFSRPNIGEFGWAIVIGLAAALIGASLHWLAPRVHRYAERRTMLVLPAGGLVVAGLAIAFSQATGKSTAQVLFSGQSSLGPLVEHAASYSAGALVLCWPARAWPTERRSVASAAGLSFPRCSSVRPAASPCPTCQGCRWLPGSPWASAP